MSGYRQHRRLSVERTLKECPFLRDLSKFIQRHQLEAAAVLMNALDTYRTELRYRKRLTVSRL